MTYAIKETYYTLQGEGAQTGRPAVFLRFAGCNLWSGRERDRASAICKFCDTQFVGVDGPGGGKFASADHLAKHVEQYWPQQLSESARKYVVCTGGEPLLQLDLALVQALHERGFEVGVETNGTLKAPPGLDWICVSPKAHAVVVQRTGNELKLVYPQLEPEVDPSRFADWEFEHFYLQPMDTGDGGNANSVQKAIEYCLANPRWKLSLQTHKLTGLP